MPPQFDVLEQVLPPLHLAAAKGDVLGLNQQLAQGVDVNAFATLPGNNRLTPMMFAIDGRHSDIVALLLQRGAGTSALYPPADEGVRDTMLNHAAELEDLEILHLLLRRS